MGRLLALLFALAGGAVAEELLTPGEQVHAELSAALSAADPARALPLLEEAADLYLNPCTPAEAEALLALLGSATRSPDVAIAAAAVAALGRTAAAPVAAIVEPLLKTPKKGEEKIVIAALGAAGKLAAPNLIPGLLDLGRDCPDLVASEQALLALGGYGRAGGEVRGRVFREVLQVAQLLSKRPQRWQRLKWPALRALQRLSGQRLNSVEQFADWWRVAKTRKDPFAD
jgi:hypothetical protein